MDKGHAICRHMMPLEDCSMCSRFGDEAITTAPIPCPHCAAKDAKIERLVTRAYTDGYNRGHDDTVEGAYTFVLPVDRDTYFAEEMAEWVKENTHD